MTTTSARRSCRATRASPLATGPAAASGRRAIRDFKDSVFAVLRIVSRLFDIRLWLKTICVLVSSDWGPLTVYFRQYAWNPPGNWSSYYEVEVVRGRQTLALGAGT